MWVVERFEAVQWWPDKPHEAVATSVLSSGVGYGLHSAVSDRLRDAGGQLGVIRTTDSYNRLDWQLVHPGDWLVNRGEHWELVPLREFERRFREA